MQKITYVKAIHNALHQILREDNRVFLIGQGVTSPWYVGGTTVGLIDAFGSNRIIDTPTCENCITGIALGAALAGMHPIVCYPRMDFMHYAMDQIANHIANWHFMFGGQFSVPVTLWSIINRGGEQAAQHSQALHAIFTHIPCLKVVMPSTPYDAKGLLYASIKEDNPVVFVDDRWLYNLEGEVPEELYSVPIGKGVIRRSGSDVTIVAASYMVHEALRASEKLEDEGINAEVLDLRSLKPLDENLLLASVRKTKRIVIVDGGWKTCGISAEISTKIAENDVVKSLKSPIIRVTLPDAPAPASSALEKLYYPKAEKIVQAVKKSWKGDYGA
ncbi:MAG: pyruvate dehydrogenase complex E1 component subunit beta [Candidatus Bathyarchaeia archaeon]